MSSLGDSGERHCKLYSLCNLLWSINILNPKIFKKKKSLNLLKDSSCFHNLPLSPIQVKWWTVTRGCLVSFAKENTKKLADCSPPGESERQQKKKKKFKSLNIPDSSQELVLPQKLSCILQGSCSFKKNASQPLGRCVWKIFSGWGSQNRSYKQIFPGDAGCRKDREQAALKENDYCSSIFTLALALLFLHALLKLKIGFI